MHTFNAVNCFFPQGLKSQLHAKLGQKKKMPFEEDREALLENPMLDPDLDKIDFTNPVFDHEKAKSRDAAVTIQSWYRMWRHQIPYLQLKESALVVQVSSKYAQAQSEIHSICACVWII